jgi:membrane protease YdiL (CAAX protease family)
MVRARWPLRGGFVTDAGLTGRVVGDAGETGISQRSWLEAVAVLALGVAILAGATLAGAGAADQFDLWADVGTPRAYPAGTLEALSTARLGVFLATFQVTALLLTFVAARLFHGNRAALMALARPHGGIGWVVKSIAVLLVLAASYTSAVFAVDSGALLGDVQLFSDMLHTRTWWIVLLAAGIGAPIAEETLFRGLMYGVLRASPIGGIGAALVTTTLWASVHAQYSVYGLGAIFLIGLYLAWVREKTGSLMTPMLCHGIYNGTIVVALMLAPEGAFRVG